MRVTPVAPGRVAVLDPDEVNVRMMTALLADAGHEVVASDSAGELLALAVDQGADAVLLEADCGDVDGFALCAKLRGRGYRGPVIFVTGRGLIGEKVSAFAAGADDYLVKPYDGRELLARLGAVCRRFRNAEHLALGRDLRVGDATLSPGTGIFRLDGRASVYLSPTEVRLLECLMRDSPATISRDALLDRAWPNAFVGDSSRVDVVIARIRKKIEEHPSDPTYLQTIRGFGYAFNPAVKPYISPADDGDRAAASLIGA